MTTLSELLDGLLPFDGIRCEIDLIRCELILTDPAGAVTRLELPASQRSAAPALQAWGAGICLIGGEQILPWDPGLRYGLALAEGGPFLLRGDERYQPERVQTRQLIYPGLYARHPAQGPFDLFVSPDQRLLAVVNRGEGHVLIVDPASGSEIVRRQFREHAGAKLISVAVDADARVAWVCGPADRRVWRWDLGSDSLEPISGNWRYPGALALGGDTLWLLDSQQQTFVHGLSLPDLNAVTRLSIEGSSYAQQTDTPGDLLCLDPQGDWLAVLTHVNLSAPLSPRLSVIHPADRSKDQEVQLPGRGWPVMLASASANPGLAALAARHPLNQELARTRPSGLVRALLESQLLDPAAFQSQLLILSAERADTVELPADLRELIHDQIAAALKAAHGVRLSLPPTEPAGRELLVHAARLSELLRDHERLAVLLLQLPGGHNLALELSRAELVATLAARELDELDEIMAAPPAPEALRWVESGLPAGWTGLADPLNGRILQLNPDLAVSWSLDTPLMGVFRPSEVCWLGDQGFVVLDGERGQISAWTLHSRREWVLEGGEAGWNRVLPLTRGGQIELLLLDGQGRVLLTAPAGEPVLLADTADTVDICPGPGDSFWLLREGGEFARYSLAGELLESGRVDGHPSRIALSPDGGTLALFDGQVQTLWLRRGESLASHSLALPSPRYRVAQPLGMMWRSDSELVIHDAFRLLVVDSQGALVHHCLMQELRLPMGARNLAPESVFAAAAGRNLGLLGGGQTSLKEMLRRVPLFQDVSGDFLRELMNRVRTQIFNRGDLIVRRNEPGEELYLIRQGQVEVLDSKGQQGVARMGPGDLFGEVALMLGLPRNASVRAASYCELSVLRQRDLDALLPDYPEVKERLLQLARDRSQQEKLRSEADTERLQARIQTLMAQKRQTQPVTRAALGRVQTETEAGAPLAALTFWAFHPQSGQIARLDRDGKVLSLLGPLQHLVQPVACLETPHGNWVLDTGLNSLLLLEADRARLSLERWGEVFLAQPRGLAETPSGTIWIANTGRGELLEVSSGGELLQRLAVGRAPAAVAWLANGNLLVTDVRQHTVSELTPGGEEVWRYGTPRAFGRDENRLFAPEHAERLASGHTLIADTGNSRILEVDTDGRIVWSVASATGLRVIRPTRAERLASGNTLIEHSNHFYWLEISPEQSPVWRYTLPVRGFMHAEA